MIGRRVESVRRGVKAMLYQAASAVAIPHLARRRNCRRLLVLAYHGLRDQAAPAGTSWSLLPIEQFDLQLRYLRRHYSIRFIDDALGDLFGAGLQEPTACITFDDGYCSNHRLGLPALQQFDVPATVYLATGFIGTDRLIWTIELDLMFQQTRRPRIDLRPIGLSAVRLSGVEDRARSARAVIARLKAFHPAARGAALDQIRAELGVEEPAHDAAYAFMDWDEVAAMDASGLISFGGHTVNHEIVVSLDGDALDEEITGSVRTVRERVRSVSSTFAYPNGTAGDFDVRASRVLQRAGCTAAVTTIEGLSDGTTDPFAIRRFNVGNDMKLEEFVMLTSGALRRRARV
jgi:peptidoglycan/xylan/chitin deacetylase (PgdA/CDA1 family)